MGLPYRKDHTRHVPYLGGIAEMGDPVYVDVKVPLFHTISGRACNISKYIAVHERFEWWLVKNLKYPYEQAHIWANTAESWAVEGDGFRYANYNYVVEKHAKEILDEPLTNLPPGLATYPYRDEPKILEALRRAT